MYLDQKIRLVSPLIEPRIKELADQLSTILGDSGLLLNIALLHCQNRMYRTNDNLVLLARSFADSATPDALYQYSTLTNLNGDQLRDHLNNQVYKFITLSSNYIRNSSVYTNVFNSLKPKNMYIVTDRVSDDVALPFIDVKICIG